MDLVNFMVNLFLAVLPNHLNVISASLAQVMFWAPLVIWAYVALGKDFARNHPFIVAGMLATGFAHITYQVWGHFAFSSEAPLALGMMVLAGYAVTLIGLLPAFIRERNISRGCS